MFGRGPGGPSMVGGRYGGADWNIGGWGGGLLVWCMALEKSGARGLSLDMLTAVLSMSVILGTMPSNASGAELL